MTRSRIPAPTCELSIVMPCLNEAETLASCIVKAQRFLHEHQVVGEVVIADNGSTDESPAIALAHGARLAIARNRGYGSALMAGIRAARGRYVIMGDADDSYDFTRLQLFLDELRAGADLVMGNRFSGGIAPGAMPPLHRYLGNPVLTAIGRIFFRSNVRDFHCGLRGFDRDAILGLDLRTTGMEFASEMVVRATLHGLTIREVPTTLSVDGRSRPPYLRSWRDGWRHLRFLLLFSPRWLFLYPGLLLMIIGLLAGLWLLPAQRSIGPVTFDIHTLLYAAAAVVVGFQVVLFAIFTKIFAISTQLLPPDRRLERFLSRVSLEVGLILGGLLLLSGIAISVVALVLWSRESFGALIPTAMLRVIIPAVTLLILGAQVIWSSFFLSILGMRGSILSEPNPEEVAHLGLGEEALIGAQPGNPDDRLSVNEQWPGVPQSAGNSLVDKEVLDLATSWGPHGVEVVTGSPSAQPQGASEPGRIQG